MTRNGRDLEWRDLVEHLQREVRERGSRRAHGSDCWTELERRLHLLSNGLFRGIAGISAEDREDLVQEILLKLQSPSAMHRAGSAINVEGYLRAMLRNAGYDLARRRNLEGRTLVRLQYWPQPIFHLPSLERQEMRARLLEEMRRLKPADHELIVRRFWDGLSIKAIAEEMDLRYSTVAVRLHRLTRRLAARMQDEGVAGV